MIDEEEKFNFYPYVFTPWGIDPLHSFDLHNQEMCYDLGMH